MTGEKKPKKATSLCDRRLQITLIVNLLFILLVFFLFGVHDKIPVACCGFADNTISESLRMNKPKRVSAAAPAARFLWLVRARESLHF